MSTKLCFAENTIKIVFSAEHSFCASQIVKPLFEGKPKWHFCNQKCHFGFSPVPAETPIFVVFGDFEWAPKKDHFAKQIVATKMHTFFDLPNTNSVCLFSKTWHFYKKGPFLFTTTPPQNTIFLGFFWNVRFPVFFSCFLFFLSPT